MNKHNIEPASALVKPMYFGLAINVFLPASLILLAYYFEDHGFSGQLPDSQRNLFFIIFAIVAASDATLAFFLRGRFFEKPVARSVETFAADFTSAVMQVSLIVSAITASIAIVGLVFYLIGGGLEAMMLFCVVSVLAYQLTRPRIGYVEKALERQEKFAESHQWAPARDASRQS